MKLYVGNLSSSTAGAQLGDLVNEARQRTKVERAR